MATSGRGSGIVGYNVQMAVDTEHHLIVAHEVVNEGTDRALLSPMSQKARTEMGTDTLDVVADRGYFDSQEILACSQAGITVTLPKSQTSNNKAKGRFVRQDFRYVVQEDVHICPAVPSSMLLLVDPLAYAVNTECKRRTILLHSAPRQQGSVLRHHR